MAKSVDEFKQIMNDEKDSNVQLATLNSPSGLAIWRNWIHIIAVIANVVDKLFDNHKAEVKDMILNERPHFKTWYRNQALEFRLGQELEEDETYYSNEGYTDEEIEEMKIISQAAVSEDDGFVIMKIARTVNGVLAPVSEFEPDQLTPFKTYFEDHVKDAGVDVKYRNLYPDYLRLSYDIYYNPLILDGNGARLDGTSETPIQDVVDEHLKNIKFDGLLVLASLTDALQDTDGVEIPTLINAQSKLGAADWLDIGPISDDGRETVYLYQKDDIDA